MKFRLVSLYLAIPVFYTLLVIIQYYSELRLMEEDGIVEYIGAISFLLTSIIFFYLFRKSRGSKHTFIGKHLNLNLFFLFLGLIFFFGFGEEISWGQRIIGWDTPTSLAEANAQQETNIHNLWIFQAYREDGSYKGFLELFLNMNRLFSVFWLLFCIICPLLYHYTNWGKSLIQFLGIPIVDLPLGGLFLFNFIIFRCFIAYHDPIAEELDEVKEMIYAVIFFLVALNFKNRRNY